LVISAFSITNGLSQLPAGFLADKIKPRIMVTISILGIGLSGIFMGFSQNLTLMLIFLILLGIFGGGYHPSVTPLLAASVPPKVQGKAFGFHIVGGNAAFFIAPLLGAAIAAVWNWRGAFLGLSIPVIIFGVIFYILIGKLIVKSKSGHPHKDDLEPKRTWVSKPGQLTIFIILTSLISSLSASAGSFLPFIAQDRFAIGAAAAAIYVSVANSAGFWASPIGGILSDRIGSIPTVLLSCIAAGPFIYFVTVAPYGVAFIIALLIWGALISIRMPSTESYIMNTANPKRISTILGISYAASQHGTGLMAPLLGFLIDRTGYVSAFQIVALISFGVTLILGTMLWRSEQSYKNQQKQTS
jgi:MFS transporter, DHA1 family, purine base/nucleoside efflux pump